MKIKIVILMILTGFGCSQYHGDDILLQIGCYKLTVADYEFSNNNVKHKVLTYEQLQDELIEEGRIIAYALEHKYDTIGILNKQLDYAMYYYASEVDGYVWNKKVKPLLKVTEDDIRKAYKMRSHEYNLSLIYFPNEELLKKYYKTDHLLESERDFYSVKGNILSDPNVKFYSTLMRYPFYPLGIYINKIVQANVGDVFGPFETLNGYYMVHVAYIRKVIPRSYEQEKTIINQELFNGLKEKYIWESQQQIFRDTKPKMYDDAIAEMTSKVDVKERKWPDINRNLVLMEYDFSGEHRIYTAADFIEFVHCQPMFSGLLSDPDDVKKMLEAYLMDIYLFAKAQQMNIENDEEYQLFRKRYQHNIFSHHYKQMSVYPKLIIPEEEIESYYRKHQNDLKCFESASVSIYKFKDIQSAFEGRELIVDQSIMSSTLIESNMRSLPKAETIEFQVKESEYDKKIIDEISKLNAEQVSMPVEINGKYCLIYLTSKSGSIPMPYKYTEEDIRQKVLSKKEKEIVVALETEYPVKVNHLKEYMVEVKKRK